jgi:hypothetical protein
VTAESGSRAAGRLQDEGPAEGPEDIAANQASPGAMTSDFISVFWLDGGIGGRVMLISTL